MHKYLSTFILVLVALSLLSAQNRPDLNSTINQGSGGARIASGPEEYIETEEDTISVRYFTLDDISKRHIFKDTLLDDLEKYSTARQFKTAALNLGNLGSSHIRMRYEPRESILTIPGFSQYRNYQIAENELRYYTIGRAFNDLSFTPLAGQDNFKVQAKFSANFANDLNMSIDLNRINQVGFYNGQETKSTAFALGFWKNYKEKNLQTFFSFVANNNNEEHNGGVIAPSEFRVRIQEQTFLNNASGRHQNFKYAIDNFFSIKDNKYHVHHQILLEDGFYHYGDDDVNSANDTIVYGEQYLTNELGIRYFMDVLKVKNTFDLSFTTKSIGLKLGILHQFSKYERDLDILRVNDILALADLDINIGKVASLDAHGELGLGSNAGNIKLTGLLEFSPISDITIRGKLKLLRYDPTLIQQSLSVSNTLVYDNELAKTNELFFGAELSSKKLNLNLEFNSGVIDRPVYYDNQAIPIQKNGTTEYIQAIATHKLRWRFIGLENSVCFQQFSDNVYQLPDLFSIHNIYMQFPLFRKKLLTRLGAQYYYTRINTPLEYFPITGGFIPADLSTPPSPSLSEYPYVELYANFKIESFRLFVKAENFHDLINPFSGGIPHYQIINYPQFDNRVRMGVRWIIRG